MKCYVANDLMPLYAEDLLSAETAADLQKHLEECADCARTYANLAAQETETIAAPQDVQPLKKLRARNRKKLLFAAAAAALMVTLFYRFCVIGTQLRSDQIHMEISTAWRYYTRSRSIRRYDTLEEAEQHMQEDEGSDLTEYLTIVYTGDCLDWRGDGYKTSYIKDADSGEYLIPSTHTVSFYAVMMPTTFHKTYWAKSSSSFPVLQGSLVTIRCRNGDFTYDAAVLAQLAHDSPDGTAGITVGDKLTPQPGSMVSQ